MNIVIWLAVGAATGWIVATAKGVQGTTSRLENVLVGIFGAFVGGDFLASVLSGGATTDTVFRMSSLGLAVGAAVVMLVLLGMMRALMSPAGARTRKKPRY